MYLSVDLIGSSELINEVAFGDVNENTQLDEQHDRYDDG